MWNKEKYREQFLINVLREIADEENLEMKTFSDDWIITLQKRDKIARIFGYNFGINDAVSAKLAKDKVATYTMLSAENIPAVEHFLIPGPEMLDTFYKNNSEVENRLANLAHKFNYRVVLKPLRGSLGKDVFFVNNETELDHSSQELFQKYDSLAMCPFYEIESECRVVMLDGEVQTIFRKERPSVIGDGKSSILELTKVHFGQEENWKFELAEKDLEKVLAQGEEFLLSLKHNLSGGASPEIINGGEEFQILSDIAKQSVKAIGIRFASVDIIKIGQEYKVLEINSNVAMKNFALYSEENFQIAKGIYRKAILKMVE